MLWAQESGDGTIISFSRLLGTADAYDIDITNNTMFLLWAYHTQDGIGTQYGKHVATGSFLCNFYDAPDQSTTTTTNAPTLYRNISTAFPDVLKTPLIEASMSSQMLVWWSVNVTERTIKFTLQGMHVHSILFCIKRFHKAAPLLRSLTFTGATSGWIGIGIGNTQQMSPSDTIVGWVSDLDGRLTLLDTWSSNYDQV